MPGPRKRKRRGVYQIRNLINGLIYVGSSEDLDNRWRIHQDRLKRGNHPNARLLADFQEHGLRSFIWEELELSDDDDLYAREDWWIDKLRPYDPNIGYNMYPSANGKGFVRSAEVRRRISDGHKGKRFTEEHRRKISESLTGLPRLYGEAVSAGRKASPKAQAAIKALNAAKRVFSDEEVRRIRSMTGSHTAIARELGVSRRVIRAILSGETYAEIR